MALPKKHLYNDEVIVIDRHPHWWTLGPRTAMLVAASAFGIFAIVHDFGTSSNLETVVRVLAALLVVAALGAFLIRLVGWRTTNFTITSERCIYRKGVLKKTGIEIPLDRISTVFFSQSVFERMLKSGDLGIESAGEGSRQNFSDIYDPVGVQNTIYQQMEQNDNRKYDRIGNEAREAAAGIPTPTQVLTVAEQIEKLADLHARGVITDAEFEAQKAQLLS